jgi:protein-tyrosine kinase
MENSTVRTAQVENLATSTDLTKAAGVKEGGGSERLVPTRRGNFELVVDYTHTQVQKLSREHLRRHRILTGKEPPHISNSYTLLRTQVLQRLAAQGWNTLAVTSCGPGQGKTVTAINLAICLSRTVNHSVLLVDLDLRRPSVHRYLGLSPRHGIGDYLLHDVPLQDIMINPGLERLVILPGKQPLQNSSEMLSSPKTSHLVQELKTRYPERIVVFDLPPILAADDTLAFSPNVDAALLVLEENGTTRDDIARSINLLTGVNILGTVLNKSHERMPGS